MVLNSDAFSYSIQFTFEQMPYYFIQSIFKSVGIIKDFNNSF